MPRKKASNQDEVLSHIIAVRVTKSEHARMEKLKTESRLNSAGEIVRRIIGNKKIRLFYKDTSMDGPMEELVLIYKELRAIGHNINQITRSFHQHKLDTQRVFFAGRAAAQYKIVGDKVDQLLSIVSKLSDKWLQGSQQAKASGAF